MSQIGNAYIDKRPHQIKKPKNLVLLLKERGGVLTQKCTKMFNGAKTKNDQDTLKHKLNTYVFLKITQKTSGLDRAKQASAVLQDFVS